MTRPDGVTETHTGSPSHPPYVVLRIDTAILTRTPSHGVQIGRSLVPVNRGQGPTEDRDPSYLLLSTFPREGQNRCRTPHSTGPTDGKGRRVVHGLKRGGRSGVWRKEGPPSTDGKGRRTVGESLLISSSDGYGCRYSHSVASLASPSSERLRTPVCQGRGLLHRVTPDPTLRHQS